MSILTASEAIDIVNNGLPESQPPTSLDDLEENSKSFYPFTTNYDVLINDVVKKASLKGKSATEISFFGSVSDITKIYHDISDAGYKTMIYKSYGIPLASKGHYNITLNWESTALVRSIVIPSTINKWEANNGEDEIYVSVIANNFADNTYTINISYGSTLTDDGIEIDDISIVSGNGTMVVRVKNINEISHGEHTLVIEIDGVTSNTLTIQQVDTH
jgi:hypothetical protein